VETLGSVNIICTDKTGTLTQNRMTVSTCYNLAGDIPIERGVKNNGSKDIQLLAKAMILASDATYKNKVGTGDPTEIALLLLGDDLGIDRKFLQDETKRVGEFPFDSERKLMSTLIKEEERLTVYTKGALGSVLKIVTHILDEGKVIAITDQHKKLYLEAAERMSDEALRTLAICYKPVKTIIHSSEMEKEMILLGIVGMIDPPRKEVKAAIKTAKDAGITAVMITGDHKNTAFAIARELGMADSMEQAITGKEMNALSENGLKEKIKNYRIFARVSPQDKVTIVRMLKEQGNVVSMTGDGVNDAPSLNAADIGVAMGITGSDVAKQASDMILADDNFATIVSAIKHGRTIYNNIKKAVIFLLVCNLGEVIAMLIPLAIGWEAPLIASQLLWINLMTDSLPAIALGMDPKEAGIMLEKPHSAKESFFSKGAGLHVVLGGILIGGITVAAFCFGYYHLGYTPFSKSVPAITLEYARTMGFIALVFCQLFYALASRNYSKSIFQIGVLSNKYVVGSILLGILLQLMILAIPFMRNAFHLQVIDLKSWCVVLALSLVPLIISELFKIGIRMKMKKSLNVKPAN
jgi:P-type Ca2+ transporter type 2C